ncbi:MAG: helix-turn-helix transcriptional regulator [Gemmatimonadetes bacterium]|nr:helix-turn-helix transcriptional regulator [Gemmatimonadota bacterium]MDA1104139.1 helix-turn-helix transcriptional regulator [Gemmatimonadota bacterium]
MPRGEYLGEFEQMVMLAVARLGGGAYGIAILEEIQSRTGAEAAVASVYAALDRLERQEYVSSKVGDPTPERGGRAKRFFALEPAGVYALRRSRSALHALWDGLELDLDGAA